MFFWNWEFDIGPLKVPSPSTRAVVQVIIYVYVDSISLVDMYIAVYRFNSIFNVYENRWNNQEAQEGITTLTPRR
jgi:hypothetical protein